MPRRAQRRLSLTERMKDGRIYRKSTTTDTGIIYLRCQKSTLCHGTAKIVKGAIVELNFHSPYCLPDHEAEPNHRFKQALKEALQRHWYKLRELYNTLAAVHPEAAENISFASIRSYMKECRRNHYPPSPQNIRDFATRLMDPQYDRNLEYDTGRLSVQLITDENGDSHAVLYDAQFIPEEMNEVNKLLIDGTFRCTPSIGDAYQLVTIMGIKFNHGFPFIWIVMSRKTELSYLAVLRHIKQYVIPNNEIILVMSDFECALRNAIREIFATAHSTGCNVHYDRALYQKAKSLGMRNLLRQNADAKLFFKKVLALAYLPSRFIEEQYQRLKNELDETLRRRLHPFLQYYNRYWLGIVKPHGFSVYGLGRRTNNIIESYHSQLGHRMEAHPGAWDFVCKLLKLHADVKSDIQRLRNNRPISRHPRYSTIFKHKRLVKAWRELHMREITVDEFLQKAASLKGNVSDIIQIPSNGREGVDFEVQETPVAIDLENDPDYEREVFAEEPPLWLIDNAGPAVARVDDILDANNSGSAPSDNSDNDSAGEVGIHALEAAVDASEEHSEVDVSFDEHEVAPQTPPVHEHAADVDAREEPNEVDVLLEEHEVAPQSPPVHEYAADVDAREEPNEVIGGNDAARRMSTVSVDVRRTGNRRRNRKRQPRSQQAPEVANTSEKKQKINKRRKDLRKRAIARIAEQQREAQAAAETEAERLRNELLELRRQTTVAHAEAQQQRELAEYHDVPVRSHSVESLDNKSIRISTDVAAQRLALLRQQMKLYDVDAYIITTADVHQTEYIAERDERRSWLSGFTGSAGTAVVTLESAALWTDSRYYEAATLQLSDDWILMKSGLSSTPTLQAWLTTVLSANTAVGVDPEIVTYSQWISWNTTLGVSQINLMALDTNLIDVIWEDQPEYPSGLVFEHPIEFAGLKREEKLANIRDIMVQMEVDLYVITALDEIAWITNLRGSDIPHTPIFRSYLLITAETATIYIPSWQSRLNESLVTELTSGGNLSLAVAEYEDFWTGLAAAGELATVILLPAPFSYALGISYKVYSTVPSSKVKLATSPVLLVKDRKTEIEANGLRNAHLKDAVALCQFLEKLETAVKNSEEYDELQVVEELSAFRSAQEYSFGDSFDTIAGYGPNSALPHYIPTNETNAVIGTESVFMLDSGGQYYDGTTDVTRSMHYGTPTEEQRATYTALLAGCIDLARLVFPAGASYTTTDLLMRTHLHRLGKNYGHGSTHGIGHFSLIHEAWNTTYDVNFIGSQEPGYYQEGSWGMRLENIVAVVPANTTYTAEDTFLTFETLTLVPYARNMIDETKLSDDELSWLNEYHATVRVKVGAELLRQGHNTTYDWLVKQTVPIAKPISRRINMVAIA